MMTFNFTPVDAEILKILSQNAKLSQTEIGKKLSRSRSAIAERIKLMEEEGIIKNYAAIVDHKKISNLFTTCVLVRINNHTSVALDIFKKDVSHFEEVLECLHITGHYDFFIKVVVEHMPSYHHFLNHKLGHIANLGEVTSLPVIDEAKREVIYPIIN